MSLHLHGILPDGAPLAWKNFLERLFHLVNRYYFDRRCAPLRSAIDPRERPEYARRVGHPMYIYRIRKKIQEAKYFCSEQVLADVRLIEKNAVLAQEPDKVQQIARWFRDDFESRLSRMVEAKEKNEKVIAEYVKSLPPDHLLKKRYKRVIKDIS